MRNRVSSDLLWGLLSALLISGVFILTLWGNSNNLNPRYLFIDEQITFYPVSKILNPSGLDEFLWLISDGSDYRYGRILWNSIAVAALLPAKLFGISGQIVATRELSVLLLLSSYLLLVTGFLKTPSVRFFALLTLIALPYNSYYMSMPKPEPLMIFATSLFLYLNSRDYFLPGRPSWILLGIAFGAKISFIVPVAIIFTASILNSLDTNKITIRSHLIGCLYLLMGFLISNPYFLQPAFFFSYPILIIFIIFKIFKRSQALLVATTLLVLCMPFILENGTYEFILKDLPNFSGINHALGEWSRGTFLKVNDGTGAADQNFYSWFIYFCKILYPPLSFLGFIFQVLLIIVFSLMLKALLKSQHSNRLVIFNSLSIFIIGIALILVPMLTVKNRLWGMYFFPGLVFTCTAIIIIAEGYIEQVKSGQLIQSKKLLSTQLLLVIIFHVITLTYLVPEFINSFIYLGTRDPSNPKMPLLSWLIGV